MAAAWAQRETVAAVPALKRKVIVADDAEFNRLVLSRILSRLGFDVLEAATGEEAVNAFRERLQEADEPVVVLMDINMPEMDGLEASMRIRQLEAQAAERPLASGGSEATVPSRSGSPSPGPAPEAPRLSRRVPIWAVSSCSEREQLSSPAFAHIRAVPPLDGPPWKLAGIDAFMGKPVDARQLQEKLAALQQQQQPPQLSAVPAHAAVGSPAKRVRSASPGALSPTKRSRGGREASEAPDSCARELLGEASSLEDESTSLLVPPCLQ